MLANYLSIAIRSLRKNGAFSAINVLGLAIGMAAFLFIVHYVRFERSYESYNPNADNIVRITLDIYRGNEYVVTDCETHAPMAPMMKEKFPEVVDYVRMFHNDGLKDIKVLDRKFLEEGIYFADPSAFRMLDVNLITGDDKTALNAPFEAVMSESTAMKLFGRKNALGESLEIDGNMYHVSGVFQDMPVNTHLKFGILLSHNTLLKKYEWYKETDFNGNNEYAYLQLAPGTNLPELNAKIASLCATLKDKLSGSRYTAQPIRDIHLLSNKTFEPEANGNARVVWFLSIVAIFIILIAWVNYVNLSTARAIERAREVGIRKVMGSLRTQLVFQFLSEAVIVNIVSGFIAFTIFIVALPVFRELTGQPLPMHPAGDPVFWYYFVALIAAGSILSGIYPAFVLSSFQPGAVLKGKFQNSAHGQLLRKGLVVFQFGATVVLIVSVCTVYLQVKHLRSFDLGMKIDQTLVIRTPQTDLSDSLANLKFQSLKNELQRDAAVIKIARSGSLPGLSLHELSSTSTSRVGQDNSNGTYEYYFFSVDADFFPAMDIKFASGRNFQDGVPNHDLVVINEEAVKRFGFSSVDDALGGKIKFQTRWPGEPATIIGVVKNFYQRSPKEAHIPMLFKYAERNEYVSVKLKTNEMQEALANARAAWDHVYPGYVFSYFFLDDRFNQQYKADGQFGQVMATFSGLAVIIACLGLFGLSSYTIVQRTKEIGIRKVLGASVGQIVGLLSSDFLKVVALASLIAIPVSFLAMKEWLSNYAVRIDMNVWLFVIPVGMILLIALITVSVQTIKTAVANPVKSLRQE